MKMLKGKMFHDKFSALSFLEELMNRGCTTVYLNTEKPELYVEDYLWEVLYDERELQDA